MGAPAQVTRDQRHTKQYPCRICAGHAEMTPSKGIRCAGFRSADGEWEHCQREQYAGALPLDESTTPPTFAHRLRGQCKCGATHGPALVQPARRLPARETRYELRDASGTLRGIHVRIDFLDSAGKPYQPKRMFWKEHHGLSSLEMPLYNLAGHLSASTDALRILCEGEKAADALNAALKRAGRADMLALATVTGAPAFPCDASLQPLRGVPVALWADNDADGRKQMERIAERLEAMGAEPPRWVEWKDAPAKGDAADFFARGGTVEQLAKMASGLTCSDTREDAHIPDERLSEWNGGALLSDVQPERIEWLWDGYIPLRKLTMGDGDPGLGKTMLYAADLAARVTMGDAMPDGSPGISGGAGVVIFTAEDDPADTLQPRLVATGGDLKRVLVVTTIQRPDDDPKAKPGAMIERLPTFADDKFIERAIKRVNAKLVIFDPFMAYLPSGVNSFRDQDVRSALAPLSRLAQKTGAAFVLIRHLNKGNFANALYRGGGSIGIIGAARSGLLVVKDPDDENARIFGATKSNLGKPMPSWKYTIIETGDGTPRIQWEGQSERSASELLNQSNERDTTSKLETACDILRTMLADTPQPEKDIEATAKEQGISRATLRRAKECLGVESSRQGGTGKDGYWVWSLPNVLKDAQDSPYGVHTHSGEHLSENLGGKPAQQATLPKGAHGNVDEHLSAEHEHHSGTEEADEWNL